MEIGHPTNFGKSTRRLINDDVSDLKVEDDTMEVEDAFFLDEEREEAEAFTDKCEEEKLQCFESSRGCERG